MKLLSVILFFVLAGSMAFGQERSAAEKYFSDVELVDQNGQRLHFYSDVLKTR